MIKSQGVEAELLQEKAEYHKLKSSINQIRSSIEDAEKKFKHFIYLKRRIGANGNQNQFLSQDPATVEDLIKDSKEELAKFKNTKQLQTEDMVLAFD